jgi:hypothetical protein
VPTISPPNLTAPAINLAGINNAHCSIASGPQLAPADLTVLGLFIYGEFSFLKAWIYAKERKYIVKQKYDNITKKHGNVARNYDAKANIATLKHQGLALIDTKSSIIPIASTSAAPSTPATPPTTTATTS